MYQNPYIKLKPKTRKPYTYIYLIRHGNPDYTQEKDLGEHRMPLSEFGLKQGRLLAKRLKALKISKVYSSELTRAQETARLFTKLYKKKIFIDKRLNEIDWLDWYRIPYFNMSEKRRVKKLKHYAKLDRKLDQMQTKTRRLVADIYRQNKGRSVALFCHGNIIKAILSGILNADVIGFLSLEIYQASISKLVIDNNGFVKIDSINSVSHLRRAPEEDLFITLLD
ncbi:MAG: histidine phosphatase family protein [Candidatus Falkowbacteria bacterium]|nr:histidine phosphatase family protein [Candidatus Falkowbacteria bacterium]